MDYLKFILLGVYRISWIYSFSLSVNLGSFKRCSPLFSDSVASLPDFFLRLYSFLLLLQYFSSLLLRMSNFYCSVPKFTHSLSLFYYWAHLVNFLNLSYWFFFVLKLPFGFSYFLYPSFFLFQSSHEFQVVFALTCWVIFIIAAFEALSDNSNASVACWFCLPFELRFLGFL